MSSFRVPRVMLADCNQGYSSGYELSGDASIITGIIARFRQPEAADSTWLLIPVWPVGRSSRLDSVAGGSSRRYEGANSTVGPV